MHVVSSWSDGRFAQALTERGIETVSTKLGRLYWRRPLWTLVTLKELPSAVRTLRNLIRSYRPDIIVHLDNRAFLTTYPAFIGLGCKHVYRQAVMPQATVIERLTYRLIFSTCRLVVVNSMAVYEQFQRLGFPAERLSLVENGTDCDALKPGNRPQDGVVRIGIVGQAIQRKGHDILLDAFRTLLRQGHDIRLVIVGNDDGEYARTIKARISDWAIDPFVTWTGVISDKKTIYQQFDILTVPSRSDAFPNVALEAGAAGLPVVASRTGGLTTVIADGETGYLVEPESAEALANALERLIRDPNLRLTMGAAARQRVESRFDADRMASDFIRAVEAVI